MNTKRFTRQRVQKGAALLPDKLNGRQLLPVSNKVLRVNVPVDMNSGVLMEKFYFPDTPILDNLTVVGVSVVVGGVDANYTLFQAGNIEFYVFTLCDESGGVIFEKFPVKSICSAFVNPLSGPVGPGAQAGKVLPLNMRISARNCYVQNTATTGGSPFFRNMEFLFYCL